MFHQRKKDPGQNRELEHCNQESRHKYWATRSFSSTARPLTDVSKRPGFVPQCVGDVHTIVSGLPSSSSSTSLSASLPSDDGGVEASLDFRHGAKVNFIPSSSTSSSSGSAKEGDSDRDSKESSGFNSPIPDCDSGQETHPILPPALSDSSNSDDQPGNVLSNYELQGELFIST